MEMYYEKAILAIYEFSEKIRMQIHEKPVWSKNQVLDVIEKERNKFIENIKKAQKQKGNK